MQQKLTGALQSLVTATEPDIQKAHITIWINVLLNNLICPWGVKYEYRENRHNTSLIKELLKQSDYIYTRHRGNRDTGRFGVM